MSHYVSGFQEIDRTQVAAVGGKGAHLGELSRIEGIHVPAGFCVTTDAFRRILTQEPSLAERLDRLSRLKPDDREAIRTLSAEIRRAVEAIAIPDEVAAAITHSLARLGEPGAYAIRSSATAEDLPSASFAGQQDSYLNIVGRPAILEHIARCWASLFTERAIAYRLQHGFDHRRVYMAVVVQKMVLAQASGILFTADPVTGNRRVTSIDAGFGLGEALVWGLVNVDGYRVRNGQLVGKTIAAKKLETRALAKGGIEQHSLEAERQNLPALTDPQVLRLERVGRQIEAHFGEPQDIEWCLSDDEIHIVQSRPITTLFPIPVTAEQGNRVYLSVGHAQMMTDPMKPLGLSLFQRTAGRPMLAAGGRLFVDPTRELSSPASRTVMLNVLGGDPLTRDALTILIERGDFFVPPAEPNPAGPAPGSGRLPPPELDDDPAIVTELIARNQASVDELVRDIRSKSGIALLDFIIEDIQRLKNSLTDPRSFAAILAGMNAYAWLNEKMMTWLGEKNAADTLSQSAPNNITSEMGLALLHVADVIRPHPAVIEYLEHAKDDRFLEGLLTLDGGREAHDVIGAYLNRYGMRCAGEIDVTRTRWSESPTTLVPLILSHRKNFEPGAGSRKFEQGRLEAAKKEQELVARLKQLPDGEPKAVETQRMIRRLRTFMGYREYPKYGIVNRYFVYKRALLEEAARLVQANVLDEKEDIFHLTLEELHDVVRTQRLDDQLISRRKTEFERYRKLTPPRVMTSDGEIIAGAYRRADFPVGALVGLAVSSGVVEGRARVLLDMADAEVEAGDIVVTAFTDPSWTPLFVSIKGLVTEVGGLMTHGAVIAREYGLPAVVGVEHATRRIRDGQRIRVNGTDGYVELLS